MKWVKRLFSLVLVLKCVKKLGFSALVANSVPPVTSQIPEKMTDILGVGGIKVSFLMLAVSGDKLSTLIKNNHTFNFIILWGFLSHSMLMFCKMSLN